MESIQIKSVYELQDEARAEAETALGGKVYRVPVYRLDWLNKQVERINKRATKIGVAPVTVEEIVRDFVEVTREREPADPVEAAEQAVEGKRFYRTDAIEHAYIIVRGETPRVAGYEFVATLEHEDVGTIIRRVPRFDGEVDLTAYRDASPEHCDHCGLVRNRKDTYIVYNAERGETKQVGRTCLKDFTGAHNPEQFARLAEALRDFFEVLGGDLYDDSFGGGGESHYRIEAVLAHTVAAIEEYGWVSKKLAYDTGRRATADLVDSSFGFRPTVPLDPTEEQEEKALAVLEWVRSDAFEENVEEQLRKNPDNDYLWNLRVSTSNDYVNARKFGIVCSAVAAYDREREFQIKREAKVEKQFVGVEGERSEFVLTLTRIVWVEDRYNGGTKPLYIFQDGDGNDVKWFATNPARDPSNRFEDIAEGDTFRVKATVKRHEDDPKYGKSTLVTRAKVEEKLSEVAA